MSIARKRRRRTAKELSMPADINPHLKYLVSLIEKYCNFLDKKDKPSDEEVRAKFKAYDSRWIQYCISHQFEPRASLLFNQEVARIWRERYAKPKNTTEK